MAAPLKCEHTIFHENCKHCVALQAEYYQKLKETQFNDIEDLQSPARLLKAWHSFRFSLKGMAMHQNPEEYYRLANEILHTHPFEQPIHRYIWELHCEGKSKRQIEAIVAQSDFEKKYKRESILNIIRKISREIIR